MFLLYLVDLPTFFYINKLEKPFIFLEFLFYFLQYTIIFVSLPLKHMKGKYLLLKMVDLEFFLLLYLQLYYHFHLYEKNFQICTKLYFKDIHEL